MARPQNFLMRPRYLRAIPSLMLLTTAVAWGVASDADVVNALNKKARVTLSHKPGTSAGDGGALVPPWLKARQGS